MKIAADSGKRKACGGDRRKKPDGLGTLTFPLSAREVLLLFSDIASLT